MMVTTRPFVPRQRFTKIWVKEVSTETIRRLDETEKSRFGGAEHLKPAKKRFAFE